MKSSRHYAKSILIQLVIVAVVVVLVVWWQHELLASLYSRDQIADLGWVINGLIAVLFAVGMFVLVRLLLRYAREEEAIAKFMRNHVRAEHDVDPLAGVDPHSAMYWRYRTLVDMFDRRASINHAAMASTLVADESGHMGLPKFVNNVLILIGVLGTIISLSVALLGASDLISAGTESGGLTTVIKGMSTALSTTMTAIVAYLVFGYFYLRVLDTQTHVLGRVESVTTTHLVPRFQTSPDTLINDYSRLLSTGTELIQRMDTTHKRFSNTAAEIELMLTELRARINDTGDSLGDIRDTLHIQTTDSRAGFEAQTSLLQEQINDNRTNAAEQTRLLQEQLEDNRTNATEQTRLLQEQLEDNRTNATEQTRLLQDQLEDNRTNATEQIRLLQGQLEDNRGTTESLIRLLRDGFRLPADDQRG